MKQYKYIEPRLCIECETNICTPTFFEVILKDNNNNVIIKKDLESNKYCHFNIKEYGKYLIKISPLNFKLNPRSAYRWIIINRDNNIQYFKFIYVRQPLKCVEMNFTLTDAKFTNFPIQKGVVYLWHKISQ